jgi:hypothetical protein
MTAATGAADGGFVRFSERAVALVRGFSNAASVRGRSGGGCCERKEGSDQRKQQQKSGGEALHAFRRAKNPK